MNELNFNGIDFPIKITDIDKLEKLNNISVNVFYLDLDKKNIEVVPFRITKLYNASSHANLLLLEKEDVENNKTISHYVYIKNFSRLMYDKNNSHHTLHYCYYCLNSFYNEESLSNHIDNCQNYDTIKTILPSEDKKYIQFQNYSKQLRAPFKIYADFECILQNIEDNNETNTKKYQEHKPVSYMLNIVSYDKNDEKIIIYKGIDCVEHFLININKISNKLMYKIKDAKSMIFTNEDKKNYNNNNICHICNKEIINNKVRDHCHLTGKFRGPAHNDCNINYNYKYFKIPVFIHNSKNYDTHLIIEKIGDIINNSNKYNRLSIIPQNTEKYIAVTWNNVRFLDSIQFMPSSIEKLANNLTDNDKIYTKKYFKDLSEEQLKLLLQKGEFPYDWFNCIEILKNTELPLIEDFYNKLNKKDMSIDSYNHALNVWNKLGCKTFEDYHDYYLKCDVLLLTDIFENFINVCYKNYGLDPCHYFTSPGLSWDASLKMTKVNIELITDIDMYLLFEKSLRGGISITPYRYAKANNKYMKDYNNNIDSSYISY